MKAVVMERFGGPEVLQVRSVPDPTPQPGRVVVRVRGVGVCYHDLLAREGKLPRVRLPLIPGHEMAGEVVAVGEGVEGFTPGQRIVCLMREPCGRCIYCRTGRDHLCRQGPQYGEDAPGTYSELMAVAPSSLVPLPDSVSFEEAAAISCAMGTAFHAVHAVAGLRAGETVLVTGASGGVGVHLLQLARLAGARVLALTSQEGKRARLYEAGADEVLVVSPDADGRPTDFSGAVKELSDGGVDVVFELLGAVALPYSLRSVRSGGRVVVVGNVRVEPAAINPGLIILKELKILGSDAVSWSELRTVCELVGRGLLRPIVDRTLPLDRAGEAHRILAERASVGRVVLVP